MIHKMWAEKRDCQKFSQRTQAKKTGDVAIPGRKLEEKRFWRGRVDDEFGFSQRLLKFLWETQTDVTSGWLERSVSSFLKKLLSRKI